MNEIFIERQLDLLRIVVKEDGEIKECFIEEESNSPYSGQIYKGIVKNIIPAIKCAFIDIGYSKNCYMYLDKKFNNINIKKGEEILVEVLKEEIGDKGPKVTNTISIPGSYCVLEASGTGTDFSSKINNMQFKQNLLNCIDKFDDVGFKIRTKAQGASIEDVKSEMSKLYEIYKDIIRKGKYFLKPGLVFSDKGVMDRILRDIMNKDTNRIFCDSEEDYNYIKDFVCDRPEVTTEILLHKEKRNLFDFFGIEKEILNLRNKKIYLKCGGYIIIEKTEAMYVIDVNSGSNTKSNSIEKTAFNTNLEAAKEISKQIRLRNLGGIILIDFIDINTKEYKDMILEELNLGFKDDKNKTIVYPFTELNLVQIARKRRGKSIIEIMEEKCTKCNGNGERLKFKYLLFLIRNVILRLNEENNSKYIYLKINAIYKEDITADVKFFVKEIQALDKCVYVDFERQLQYFKVEPLVLENQILHMEHLKIYGD